MFTDTRTIAPRWKLATAERLTSFVSAIEADASIGSLVSITKRPKSVVLTTVHDSAAQAIGRLAGQRAHYATRTYVNGTHTITVRF
jgi:hypothetical protein